MPVTSKYSNEQIETIIAELLAVLQKNNAGVELGLMCLGNATSHIIGNLPAKQKKVIVENFCHSLKSATND